MVDVESENQVWIRCLGAAWKIRARSTGVAERVRQVLTEQRWKCTVVTAAFDVRETVLFRATDLSGQRNRALDESLREMSGIQLMTEPA